MKNSRSIASGFALFGLSEGRHRLPQGVFAAAKLPQKQIWFYFSASRSNSVILWLQAELRCDPSIISVLSVDLGHVTHELDTFTTVSPLIVIPCYELYELVRQRDACFRVEDRDPRIVDKV